MPTDRENEARAIIAELVRINDDATMSLIVDDSWKPMIELVFRARAWLADEGEGK